MQEDVVDLNQPSRLGPKYSNWMEMRRGLMSEGNRFKKKRLHSAKRMKAVFKRASARKVLFFSN